jgi:hypothetical protein
VDLKGRYRTAIVAVVEEDGTVRLDCIQDPPPAPESP